MLNCFFPRFLTFAFFSLLTARALILRRKSGSLEGRLQEMKRVINERLEQIKLAESLHEPFGDESNAIFKSENEIRKFLEKSGFETKEIKVLQHEAGSERAKVFAVVAKKTK